MAQSHAQTILFAISVAASSSVALSQTVTTPPRTNRAAGTVVHSAAAAAGAVPKAHEVLARTVVPVAPAARPFAAGVTNAGTSIAQGTTYTGNNVAASGVTVHPAGPVTSSQAQIEANAVKSTAAQAKSAVPDPKDVECDVAALTKNC